MLRSTIRNEKKTKKTRPYLLPGVCPLDLALVGVAPLDVGVCALDRDEGFDADAAELRLSVALLVPDRLRVTRPPGVLPDEAGGVLLVASALVGVTGVVGKPVPPAPPSLDTPERLEPFESCPESQEE